MSETSSSAADPARKPGELPVNFAQFIVSLGSSALVHLGELADPASGKHAVDLTLARHTIDVLDLLQQKTRGNLDDDESRLMDALLKDLREKLRNAAAGR
ncbi:DUF1844 domain-containing protein [Myxococcota bacterium]|nr:DUF1844 domain-containing protein [Myxococcota bacterium]